jgi:hypothetical protein
MQQAKSFVTNAPDSRLWLLELNIDLRDSPVQSFLRTFDKVAASSRKHVIAASAIGLASSSVFRNWLSSDKGLSRLADTSRRGGAHRPNRERRGE